MIDWFSVFNTALWVAGLAAVLATLSHARYTAAICEDKWRLVLGRPVYERALNLSLLLFSLGMSVQTATPWWQSLLWLLLAAAFAAQAWGAQRRLHGRAPLQQADWQAWWNSSQPLIAGIWLLGILLALAYALAVRPWMQPDEPRHFEVALHVARLGKPVVYDPDLVLEWEQEIIQEMENQSFWWYGYSLVGWDPNDLPDSFVEIWSPLYSRAFFQLPLYYTVAGELLHTWGREFPLTAAVMRLRLLGVLLLGLSLWGIYRTARELFPDRPQLAIYALALSALWPSHLAANAAVNNDPMVETLVIWSVYWAVRLLRRGMQTRTVLWLSALILLTLFTKRSGFSVLVLLLVLPLWAAGRLRRQRSWRHGFTLAIAAVLSSGLFVALFLVIRGTVRNWIPRWFFSAVTSGKIWQNVAEAPLGAAFDGLLRTFIGWFGWMRVPLPDVVYTLGAGVAVIALLLALIGFAQIFGRRLQGWQKQSLFLLLLLLLSQFALTLGKDIVYGLYKDGSVPQARYLYPAISAFVLPMMLGAHSLFAGRQRRWLLPALLISLLLFNLTILVFVLYPFYWL